MVANEECRHGVSGASVAFERPKRSGISSDPSHPPRFARRGRYWDRTSDLCSVKVSHDRFARLQDLADTARGLVHHGFPHLIVSHYLSAVFSIMWTRCGRENLSRHCRDALSASKRDAWVRQIRPVARHPLFDSQNHGGQATLMIRRNPLCSLSIHLSLIRTVWGRFSSSRGPKADQA